MDRRPLPGEIFKLKPRAKVEWLCFSVYADSGIKALRCDTEIGKNILQWLKDGAEFPRPYRTAQVNEVCKDFWHDWSEMVFVRDARCA